MKRGYPRKGTFAELVQSDVDATWTTIGGQTYTPYNRENWWESTVAAESGTYSYVDLGDPAPTLYDWAGRPIPPVEDVDNEQVRTRKLEVQVAAAMPQMRDAIAEEIKSGIGLGATFTAGVKKKTDSKQGQIILPPGYHLRSLVDFLFSKKTAEKVFLPVIADLQHEWLEAIAQNRSDEVQRIKIRGYLSFTAALILVLVSGIKRIFDAWKVL